MYASKGLVPITIFFVGYFNVADLRLRFVQQGTFFRWPWGHRQFLRAFCVLFKKYILGKLVRKNFFAFNGTKPQVMPKNSRNSRFFSYKKVAPPYFEEHLFSMSGNVQWVWHMKIGLLTSHLYTKWRHCYYITLFTEYAFGWPPSRTYWTFPYSML